jgi:hypothetical protein
LPRPLEAARDAERLRYAWSAAAVLLFAVMLWLWWRESDPEWLQLQREYQAAGGEAPLVPVPTPSCDGEAEQCTSCHLSLREGAFAEAESEQLWLRPHPELLELHREQGCTSCHGGLGVALDPSAAHGWPLRDERMGRWGVQASCGRCHVPGAVQGTELLAEGAMRYLSLGCEVCHSQTGGSFAGGDLRRPSASTSWHLEQSILDPEADYPGSSMPSFAVSFEGPGGRRALSAVVLYLQSLALGPLPECDRPRQLHDAAVQCSDCHGSPSGQAQGWFEHRCVYLRAHSESLRCAGCHEERGFGAVSSANCPVLRQHRSACGACHQEGL